LKDLIKDHFAVSWPRKLV